MITKYNVEVQNEAIIANLRRITNQVYKLLPSREEGGGKTIININRRNYGNE